MRGPLIEPELLLTDGANGATLIDCRFNLADPSEGEAAYHEAHIPGARYAHLDRDLSNLSLGAGRHPLPSLEDFAAGARRCGVRADRPVVAYDAGNSLFASRLWWLLTVTGHPSVHVLSGGLAAWAEAGGELTGELPKVESSNYEIATATLPVVDADDVAARLQKGDCLLVDARGAERFAGEVEPIDKKAGHIPGAINVPFEENQADGRFLGAQALREKWQRWLGSIDPSDVIHMCGSGVTACGNRLAMDAAGFPGSWVYVGSWSDWISGEQRAIATGEGP